MGEAIADTLEPFELDHPACWTCHAYGVSCRPEMRTPPAEGSTPRPAASEPASCRPPRPRHLGRAPGATGSFRDAAAAGRLGLTAERRGERRSSSRRPTASSRRAPSSDRRLRRRLQQPPRRSRRCSRTPPAAAPRRSTASATWAASAPARRRSGRCSSGRRASIQGNYEQSLAAATRTATAATPTRATTTSPSSPTLHRANCSAEFKRWMGGCRAPAGAGRRARAAARPRLAAPVNEFLFASTTPVAFLETLLDQERCDGCSAPTPACTGTAGCPPGATSSTSASSAGRPTTATHVWYACSRRAATARVELVPLATTHRALAAEMRARSCPRSSSRPS